MSDTVNLYYNASENKVIGKTITLLGTLDCIFKDAVSIEHPVLIVSNITMSITGETYLDDLNYLYIPKFNRYYYVDEIKTLTGGRYEIRCSVDVLESFRDDILNLNVILDHSENLGANMYLDSPVWVNNCKAKTDIINFSNGLLDTGEYILITVGG